MSIKITKKGFFIFLILLLSMQMFSSTTVSQSSDNKLVSNNVWRLLQWNSDYSPQWWPHNLYVSAKPGDLVIYNVTQSNSNMTNPTSGKFSFGNVTDFQTDNSELSLQFAISVYPWYPGFVTSPSNWTYQKEEAKNAADLLQGQINITEGLANASNMFRTSYQFDFKQDLSVGNQNTTLIYDKDTGVLLYAYSEFQGSVLYKIELELVSSSLILSSNYNIAPGFTVLFPFSVFIMVYIIKKHRTKMI